MAGFRWMADIHALPSMAESDPKLTSDERSAESANHPVADILNKRLPPKTGRSLRWGQVTQGGPH
jgi:hypothetical protein